MAGTAHGAGGAAGWSDSSAGGDFAAGLVFDESDSAAGLFFWEGGFDEALRRATARKHLRYVFDYDLWLRFRLRQDALTHCSIRR